MQIELKSIEWKRFHWRLNKLNVYVNRFTSSVCSRKHKSLWNKLSSEKCRTNISSTFKCIIISVVVLWVRLLWINRKSTKHKTLTKGLQQQTFPKGIQILLPGKLTLSSMKACSPNSMHYLCLIIAQTPTTEVLGWWSLKLK